MKIDWQLAQPLPTLVKGGALDLVDGDPVYAGGMTYPWRESELAWRWDAGTGEWQPLPPMPLGRAYTDGATVDGGLLLVGGRRSGPGGRQSLGDAWLLRADGAGVYSWDRLPDLLAPRAVPAIGVCDRRVLVVGGGEWERSQGGAFATRHLTRAELLDLDEPASGWRDLGELPFEPRTGAAFASAGDSAYFFGGYECWTDPDVGRCIRVLKDTWRFDFASESWDRLGDLPHPMSGGAAVAVGCTVLLLGGVVYFERDGVRVPYGAGHTREAGTPRARWVGGYSDLVFSWDLESDVCRLLPERLPVGLNDLRCAVSGDRVFAAGGETVDAALSNTTDAFQIGQIAVGSHA